MHRNLPRTRASLPTAPRAYARAGESGRFRRGPLTLLPPYSACSSLPAGVPRPIASAAAVLLEALLGATLAVLSERSIRARPLCPGACRPAPRSRPLGAPGARAGPLSTTSGALQPPPPPLQPSAAAAACRSTRARALAAGQRAGAHLRPGRDCWAVGRSGQRARALSGERACQDIRFDLQTSRRSSLMKSPVVIYVHVLDL